MVNGTSLQVLWTCERQVLGTGPLKFNVFLGSYQQGNYVRIREFSVKCKLMQRNLLLRCFTLLWLLKSPPWILMSDQLKKNCTSKVSGKLCWEDIKFRLQFQEIQEIDNKLHHSHITVSIQSPWQPRTRRNLMWKNVKCYSTQFN